MSRRPSVRPSDLKAALEVLREFGMTPSALDTMPDGTYRWHFTKPASSDDDELDRELAEFEKRHGSGGT
ncbi:hypothetical protein JP74_09085 [Devosia sp. 17-2-E-8]|nr:hypothetical protein JP74_09085 [Devosia sp. 17-2-E-8]